MDKLGKYIWIENIHDQYDTLPGKIIEITDENYKVEVDTNNASKKEIISIDKTKEYLEVSPTCLKGVNNLQHLEDNSINNVTHNLRIRFLEQKFYTFVDNHILLSFNSIDSSEILDKEYFQIYRNFYNKNNPNPEPHIYYIAETAHQNLIKEKNSQCILLTGETGSGKRKLSKTIFKYFSYMNIDNLNQYSMSDAFDLLETFGNAKTLHNRNSSRFAKFLKIYFDSNFDKIVSYEFDNFLLETNRLIKLQQDEFSFNIFYQLFESLDSKEKKKFLIEDYNLESFNYLNQNMTLVQSGNKYTTLTNHNTTINKETQSDISNLGKTKNLLSYFKFTEKEIELIFSILIGILYIGNIEYEEVFINGSTFSDVNLEELNFSRSARLMKVDKKDFKNFLIKDKNEKNLNIDSAIVKRDNLAKNLYLFLFNWITHKINKFFSAQASEIAKHEGCFIGILEMFGNETYEISNFDQLCVNYTNEKIQKFFNDKIFQEQEEYIKEKILWNRIDYFENDDIIELFEKEKIGILSILNSDNQYNTGRFRNQLYTNFKDKNNYLGDSIDGFILIHHSTGDVIYDVNNLIENSKSSANLWKEFQPMSAIFKEIIIDSSHGNSSNTNTPSFNIKNQLDEVVKILSRSRSYFVKCIKSYPVRNSNYLEGFDFFQVGEQILSSGIIEALKLKTVGYPVVYQLDEFYKKYKYLAPEMNIIDYKLDGIIQYKNLVKAFLENVYKNETTHSYYSTQSNYSSFSSAFDKFIRIGESKIFLKNEVKKILKEKLPIARNVVLIQRTYRRYYMILRFENIVMKTLKIQNSYRHYKFKEFINKKIKSLIRTSKESEENPLELNHSKMNIKDDYSGALNLNISIDNFDISSNSDMNSLSDYELEAPDLKLNNEINSDKVKEQNIKSPEVIEIDLTGNQFFELRGSDYQSKKMKTKNSKNYNETIKASKISEIKKVTKISDKFAKVNNFKNIKTSKNQFNNSSNHMAAKNSKITKALKSLNSSRISEISAKSDNKSIKSINRNPRGLEINKNIEINTASKVIGTEILNVNILTTDAESTKPAMDIFPGKKEILSPISNDKNLHQPYMKEIQNKNTKLEINPNIDIFRNLNIDFSMTPPIPTKTQIEEAKHESEKISLNENPNLFQSANLNSSNDNLQNGKPHDIQNFSQFLAINQHLDPTVDMNLLNNLFVNNNQNDNQEILNQSLIENLKKNLYTARDKKTRRINLSLNDISFKNLLDSEYVSTIDKLKEEIKSLKNEKETFKEQFTDLRTKKDKEIEILNEKLKHLKSVIVNCEEEIKELTEKNLSTNEMSQYINNPATEKELEKLREENLALIKSLNEREGQLEILKMNQTNLRKSNEELTKSNQDFKEQLIKRKEKEENEINKLLEFIHQLQKEKIELEAKLMQSIAKLEYGTNSVSVNSKYDIAEALTNLNQDKDKNSSEILLNYKRQIINLKNDNKNLISDLEKFRFDTQIEIIKLNSELKEKSENYEKVFKDFTKLEIELTGLRKENSDLLNSNRQMKELTQKIQSRLNLTERNSNKYNKNFAQLEENLRNKENELRDLKSKIECNSQLLERAKKMESALKEELNFKENEIVKRREIIKEIQDQLENLNEENLKLKKENIQVKSKLELKEIEIMNKYENSIKIKNEENVVLKSKIGIYEKYIPEFKKEIEKKRLRIKKIKKLNSLLVELLKVKKNQMQCMEALQYTNSLNIKDNLRKFENDEKNLLKEVQDISNSIEESDDEDEEDDEVFEDDNVVGMVNKKNK